MQLYIIKSKVIKFNEQLDLPKLTTKLITVYNYTSLNQQVI